MLEIKEVVCRELNKSIYVREFCCIKQENDENIMSFYTRLKEAAYNCDFKITEDCPHPAGDTNCGRRHAISYEKMIHNALITNLSDSEIGSDYMCGENKTLTGTMKWLVTREAGKKDWKNLKDGKPKGPNVGGIDDGKEGKRKKKKEKLCPNCNRPGHGDKPSDKARELKCPAYLLKCYTCDKTGHYSYCCKNKKDDKKNGKPAQQKTTAAAAVNPPAVDQGGIDLNNGEELEQGAIEHFYTAPILVFSDDEDSEEEEEEVFNICDISMMNGRNMKKLPHQMYC